MILMAPETKGFTLEEMDDVFNSGLPAWKKYDRGSRLERLEREIQEGKVKIGVGVDVVVTEEHEEKDGKADETTDEKTGKNTDGKIHRVSPQEA